MVYSLLNDAVFAISALGILVGCFKAILAMSLKSKCENCSLCFGLINIKRDIKSEIEAEKIEIQMGLHNNIEEHKN